MAGLRKLPELNTVVLKHNSVTELGAALRGCAALVKLSMAHNEVCIQGSINAVRCSLATKDRNDATSYGEAPQTGGLEVHRLIDRCTRTL